MSAQLPCTYREFIPTDPGFWVYRMWAAERCLYVGMVGNLGPRPVQDRIRVHSRTQPWWPHVTHIDVAECDSRQQAFKEERRQLEALEPVHNGRRYVIMKQQREHWRSLAPHRVPVDDPTLLPDPLVIVR